MVPKARYMLDFKLIPETIHNEGADFVKNCLKQREKYMAFLFNHYFHNICKDTSVLYSERDFRISDNKMSGKDRILYIELPPKYYDSTVYCTAYAIPYVKTPFGVEKVRLFTVEGSVFGSTCIGAMAPEGKHIHFCEAFPTREQNIQAVYALYCANK